MINQLLIQCQTSPLQIQQIIQITNNQYFKMNKNLTSLRLMKQQKGLENDPIPNALVTREGLLNFHFCLYDLEGPYKGGIYHGLFQLHENYPFNAPKLFFYTPSGRFQTNIPICTSFTNYHQETWTSAWSVRSLILATISFMYSEEPSYGCRSDPQQIRSIMAKQSKKFNLKNPNFVSLFGQKLVKIKKISEQEYQQITYQKSIKRLDQQELINKSQLSNDEGLEQQQLLLKKEKDTCKKLKATLLKGGCLLIFILCCFLIYDYA